MTEASTSRKNIPLLDLKAQHRHIRDEVLNAIASVVDSQHFILGEQVTRLEAEIATYCSVKHAIGCASGSDAVLLALMAAGVGRGDKVLTTPYTFFATVGAISRLGATPVFVDVEEETFNIDPRKASEAMRTVDGIRVVIPVHLFGGCADMELIEAAAKEKNIWVVEDAAQSIGSEWMGRRAGSVGQIGCLSFFPSKNLGAFGDAGMLTTNDDALDKKLRSLRIHGAPKKYYHDQVGVNSRLDALQAGVLSVKLRYLDGWSAARRRNADLYREFIKELAVPVRAPEEKIYQTRHIYNQFAIVAERRDELQAYLKEQGIATEVYYPLPMHLQKCFADLGHRQGDFPISERLAQTSLALPIYPELEASDIFEVCKAMRDFFAK